MELITEKTPEQLLFDELMQLGKSTISEFGGVPQAVEKIKLLNSTIKQNPGMIRYMTDEKNIGLAQSMISGFGLFKKK